MSVHVYTLADLHNRPASFPGPYGSIPWRQALRRLRRRVGPQAARLLAAAGVLPSSYNSVWCNAVKDIILEYSIIYYGILHILVEQSRV